jgi:hypothetical protein
MEKTHEWLYFDKLNLEQWKIMDIPTSYTWIIIFFDKAFKYGSGARCWGYVAINTEPLCVEFCNFVECHSFVNYIPHYYSLW